MAGRTGRTGKATRNFRYSHVDFPLHTHTQHTQALHTHTTHTTNIQAYSPPPPSTRSAMAEAAPPPPVPQQRRKPAIPSDLPTSTAFDSTPLFPHTTENCFSDRYGRTVLLRGLNVGGCSKVPTVIPRRHAEHDTVRYGGRPFKTVEEATEWWATLRLWGVGVIRWVMTWEAIAPKKM